MLVAQLNGLNGQFFMCILPPKKKKIHGKMIPSFSQDRFAYDWQAPIPSSLTQTFARSSGISKTTVHLVYCVCVCVRALSPVFQFSRSVVSDSLRPHESQHARPPWPSPTPGGHSDSRPSSQ